jgi:hypothetical protein
LDECYLEPVSSCSLRDVYGAEVVAAWGQTLQDDILDQARNRSHSDRIVFNTVSGLHEYGRGPPQVRSVHESQYMMLAVHLAHLWLRICYI